MNYLHELYSQVAWRSKLFPSFFYQFVYIRLIAENQIAVSALSQYNTNYRMQHWVAAKRVLRYLKGTGNEGLIFSKTGKKLGGLRRRRLGIKCWQPKIVHWLRFSPGKRSRVLGILKTENCRLVKDRGTIHGVGRFRKGSNPFEKIPERNPKKETTKNDNFQRQSERRIVYEKSNFPQPNQTSGYPVSFYARMRGDRWHRSAISPHWRNARGCPYESTAVTQTCEMYREAGNQNNLLTNSVARDESTCEHR